MSAIKRPVQRNYYFLEITKPAVAFPVLGGDATSATFPGIDGSFQVLSNHAPLIGVLQAGAIVVQPTTGAAVTYRVDGGVVEVLNNNVVVLAETLLD